MRKNPLWNERLENFIKEFSLFSDVFAARELSLVSGDIIEVLSSNQKAETLKKFEIHFPNSKFVIEDCVSIVSGKKYSMIKEIDHKENKQ